MLGEWKNVMACPLGGHLGNCLSEYLKLSQTIIRTSNWLLLQHSYQRTYMLTASSNEVGVWLKWLIGVMTRLLGARFHDELQEHKSVTYISKSSFLRPPSSHAKENLLIGLKVEGIWGGARIEGERNCPWESLK